MRIFSLETKENFGQSLFLMLFVKIPIFLIIPILLILFFIFTNTLTNLYALFTKIPILVQYLICLVL